MRFELSNCEMCRGLRSLVNSAWSFRPVRNILVLLIVTGFSLVVFASGGGMGGTNCDQSLRPGKTSGSKQEVRETIYFYGLIRWASLFEDERDELVTLLEESVFSDQMFQRDPFRYLAELKKRQFQLKKRMDHFDLIFEFLMDLEGTNELLEFAEIVAQAGYSASDKTLLYGSAHGITYSIDDLK